MNGRRTLFIAAVLMLAGLLGAAGAKLHSRYKMRCDDVPCPHLTARLMAIESVIRQRDGVPSYIVIGDSHTEFADLPEICGRKPINAGIAGASTTTFRTEAKRLAELSQPDFIVVALGTNDAQYKRADGFRKRFDELVSSLSKWKVVVVPVPPSSNVPDVDLFNQEITSLPVRSAAKLDRADTTDGVHLAASSYAEWNRHIVEAASALACN